MKIIEDTAPACGTAEQFISAEEKLTLMIVGKPLESIDSEAELT